MYCRWDEDYGYRIGEYSHGIRNGRFTDYYPNGKIWAECNYIDGKEHGHWTFFNEDGSIYKEYDWTMVPQ